MLVIDRRFRRKMAGCVLIAPFGKLIWYKWQQCSHLLSKGQFMLRASSSSCLGPMRIYLFQEVGKARRGGVGTRSTLGARLRLPLCLHE